MSIKFSKALLMSGEDYQLTKSITLHHPTIKEVLSISKSLSPDEEYYFYIQILLSDPYSNMVMLDDMGINYLEVTPYDVFVLQWDNCIKNYNDNQTFFDSNNISPFQGIINALQFFMKETYDFEKGLCDDGSICFYDKNTATPIISQEIFEYIYEWVKSINNIDYSNRIKPADENARRILIEDMRDEIKKAKKRKKKKNDENSDYLGNIMSAVCFCGNSAITPFNINDCKIYWLNEALAISNRKSHSDHILDGIYHGTISSNDVNKKELDWINK